MILIVVRYQLGNRRLGDWETGGLGDWETGRLGDWETGRLGDWEIFGLQKC